MGKQKKGNVSTVQHCGAFAHYLLYASTVSDGEC